MKNIEDIAQVQEKLSKALRGYFEAQEVGDDTEMQAREDAVASLEAAFLVTTQLAAKPIAELVDEDKVALRVAWEDADAKLRAAAPEKADACSLAKRYWANIDGWSEEDGNQKAEALKEIEEALAVPEASVISDASIDPVVVDDLKKPWSFGFDKADIPVASLLFIFGGLIAVCLWLVGFDIIKLPANTERISGGALLAVGLVGAMSAAVVGYVLALAFRNGNRATSEVARYFGVTKRHVAFVLVFLFAGAVGAWCAKLLGREIMVIGFNETAATPVMWLGTGFIGAVAAGLGIYLLANTDTTDRMRTIFFAVGCGLCGQLIIAKTISSIEDTVGMKGKGGAIEKVLDEATNLTSNKGQQAVGEARLRGLYWAVVLIQKAGDAEAAGDFTLTSRIEKDAGELIKTAVVTPERAAREKFTDLDNLIAWARRWGADQVEGVCVEVLNSVDLDPSDPETIDLEFVRESILAKYGIKKAAEPLYPSESVKNEVAAANTELAAPITSDGGIESVAPAKAIKPLPERMSLTQSVSGKSNTKSSESGEGSEKPHVVQWNLQNNQKMLKLPILEHYPEPVPKSVQSGNEKPSESLSSPAQHPPDVHTNNSDSVAPAIAQQSSSTAAPSKPAQPKYAGRIFVEVERDFLKRDPKVLKDIQGLEGFTILVRPEPSSPDSKECRVQYYHPADKEAAQGILNSMKAFLGNDIELKRAEAKFIPGIRGALPKQFDLRLGGAVIEALEKK